MATGGESMGELVPDEEEQALMDRIQYLEQLEREKLERERLEQEKLEGERRERERRKEALYKRLKLLEGGASSSRSEDVSDSRLEEKPAARKVPLPSSTQTVPSPQGRQAVRETSTSQSSVNTTPTPHRTRHTEIHIDQKHREAAKQGASNQDCCLPPKTYEDDSEQSTSTSHLPATASSVSTAKLWDSKNSEQQQIVRYSLRYKTLLNNKRSQLTECVNLQVMIPYLKQLEVADKKILDKIMFNATPDAAIDNLIDYLERTPSWKLHGFIRALAMTDQGEIINLLGLEPAQYEDTVTPSPLQPAMKRKRHFYKHIESDECLQISEDLLIGLLQQCGSYTKTLMRPTLFGLKKKCVIDLTQIYVCNSPKCKKNQRERVPVGKKELFLLLFGERFPSCLSMEGPAGVGKSSFLEEYAYDWRKDVVSCEQKGPDVACPGHMWKLVVYISGASVRGSAYKAIRDNLKCDPHRKDQMMRAIEEDGEGVLVAYDALDEVRTKESIDSISSYTETSQTMVGKPKVLVTARDGLLGIDRRYFDRELHLEGFSLEQGIKYMEQYFKNMYNLQSDHSVLQYVKTHQQDLKWVLSNPLRVHILSELSACGSLTLDDLKLLTTVKLFRSLDELLVKRDRESRQTPAFQPDNFYMACLRCLLTDQRIIPEKDVDSGSPYKSLLERHDFMDKDFNDCSDFSFPHEMVFEYFSMRGLIRCLKDDVMYKYSMLMYLCSKPTMRNILQLTCGFIVQYEPQLLPDMVFIIQACLILQTEEVQCEQTELTQELLQLPAVIQGSFPCNILSYGLTAEQAAKLDRIKDLIQAMFTEKAECLKEAGWFLNGLERIRDDVIFTPLSALHTFILGCLHQCNPQQCLDVCSQTTHSLLPSTRSNIGTTEGPNNDTVVPVGGVRWATVENETIGGDLYINISAWSPCDLASALNTWSHLHRTQQLLKQHQQRLHQQQLQQQPQQLLHQQPLRQQRQYLTTYYLLDIDRSAHHLCTSLPGDPWSEEQWTPVLRELLSPSYCTGCIQIYMDPTGPAPPLGGLLSACRQVITPRHGLTRGLRIYEGEVTEEELTEFCTWACEVGLKLRLEYLTVVLRAVGGDQKDWKDIDSAIRQIVETDSGTTWGDYLLPTYVTFDRKVLSQYYNPKD